PNPRCCPGLFRPTWLSPDQYARYQRRGRHQCWPDLSLFRQQRGGHFGYGRPAQKRNPGSLGTRPASAQLTRVARNFVHRTLLRKFAENVVGLRGRSLCRSLDRKSTRLNSSHLVISYAVFCLKKKNSSLLCL